MSGLSEETKTMAVIIKHARLVRLHLSRIERKLADRALAHDLSVLDFDELGGRVEIRSIEQEFGYGSPEYKTSLENGSIQLHYSRNTHHPEYHPNGVADMGLLDLIEMVVDWKAASEARGQTFLEDRLEMQFERFTLTPEQIYVIRLIVRELA